jgi:hypothetical protein
MIAAAAMLLATARYQVSGYSPPAGGLVVDHHAVAEFDRLTEAELRSAARLHLLLRSASIGWNIDRGLNCLMNGFGERSRPNSCDRGIPPGEVIYGARFDRRNWSIELRGNPGWYGKVRDFVERVDGLSAPETVDVAAFKFNYSDGLQESAIVEQFFASDPNAKLGNVATLEVLEKRHPGIVFVWWSMSLPRRSSITMERFNQRIRAYARERNKVLFDIADIESHAPDGSPCTDNGGEGIEAICPQYTDERQAGHLNARGSQRAAKALWVLMARLAAGRG